MAMAGIGTATGEVAVEIDTEEVVVVEGLVAEEDMEAGAALEEAAVSRGSSPEEVSEPSTGAGSASSPSRRTSTTPPAPAGTWTLVMWSNSGDTKIKFFFLNFEYDDK